MKQMLMATFVGGVAFFVLGFAMYELALGSFYEHNLGSATGVTRELPVAWALVVSQFGRAALVTLVFRYAGVTTLFQGLRTGAIFGFWLGVTVSFDLYAVTNWSNVTVALVEPLVTSLRTALAGAVIGWTLGRGGDKSG
jgi:hypothetical protein